MTTRPEINIDRVKLEIQGSKKLTADDLEKLAKTIELDKGSTGFVKVMYRYYKKLKGLGEETETDRRYERPAMRIPSGAACVSCNDGEGRTTEIEQRSPRPVRHDPWCDNPHGQYLYSTVGLFKSELIDVKPGSKRPNTALEERKKTKEGLIDLRNRWLSATLTEEDIEDTFNGGVKQTRGKKVTVLDATQQINIKYNDIKPLSGKNTKNDTPSDWKNAVSLSYISPEGDRAQFRIDAEGKIIVIHFPWYEYGKTKTIETLTRRITAVIPDWKPPRSIKKAAILDILVPVTLVQGTIDIEKLKKSMFPTNADKKYKSAEHIQVKPYVPGEPLKMVFVGPELESLGGKSINPHFTQRPKLNSSGRIGIHLRHEGINYSIEIYKKGTARIIASHNLRTIKSKLNQKIVTPVIETVVAIVLELLIQKTTHVGPSKKIVGTKIRQDSGATTVSGNPIPDRVNTSTSVCRGAKPGMPSPKPEPYSFRGKCPEPGQAIFPLEGVEGKDGLWYPCCGKLAKGSNSKKSEEAYRKLLVDGFPPSGSNSALSRAEVPRGPDELDKKSGVLPRDFDKQGTHLEIKVNGPTADKDGYIKVKMVGGNRNGKFTVSTNKGKQLVIDRRDIKPESRHRLGMKNLLQQRQSQFVEKYGARQGKRVFNNYLCSLISSVGRLCPTQEMSQEKAEEATQALASVPFLYLTYTEMQKLINHKYGVLSAPASSQIVALTKGPKPNTVLVIDLQTGDTQTIEGWQKFRGTLVGHLNKTGSVAEVTVWKIGEDSSAPGLPPRGWRLVNALRIGGPIEENIIDFCSRNAKNLNNLLLVFVPIPRAGFSPAGSRSSANTPIIWTARGQAGKPKITLQLLQELSSNRQSSVWSVGNGGSIFSRKLLGKRPALNITIKNTDVKKYDLKNTATRERYVSVTPQFNRDGILDGRVPFVLNSASRSPMPTRTLDNMINMLTNRPPAKMLKPMMHKGEQAWNLEDSYVVYDTRKKRLVEV